MRAFHLYPKERKVGEVGIERGLRMPREEAPAQCCAMLVVDARSAADDGETRVRKRIAAPRRTKEQRQARIAGEVAAMRGKFGEQQNRTAVGGARDIHESREGLPRSGQQCRECRRTRGAQQQLGFGHWIKFRGLSWRILWGKGAHKPPFSYGEGRFSSFGPRIRSPKGRFPSNYNGMPYPKSRGRGHISALKL